MFKESKFIKITLFFLIISFSNNLFAKKAAIIIDFDTKETLFEINADTLNFPASLTKIMTLYITFDYLHKNKLSLETNMEVSHIAASRSPSKLYLEEGSFNNQVQNSPHYHEAKEAISEVFNDENSFLTAIKDSFKGKEDREPLDLISIIGICGVSKLAGKALECLVNGITFDDFLDILIDKTFDHMKVNTLSLFFNGLPYDFRRDLDTTLEAEFGAGIDLSSLFGIKMSEGGDSKLSDFVQSKRHAKRVQK